MIIEIQGGTAFYDKDQNGRPTALRLAREFTPTPIVTGDVLSTDEGLLKVTDINEFSEEIKVRAI